MDISIIICTRNRAASLDPTLESLKTITIPAGFNYEILVVDNGSTDTTRDLVQKRMAAQSSLRYILEASPGQSRARNSGLFHSKGKIIIFTDDDLRFPKDWLAGMCDPIMQGKGDVVAGQVRLAPHLQREWMSEWHRSWCASSEGLSPQHLDQLKGANMAFGRSVLNVVPSFDPELGPGALGFYDDTLFVTQLRHAGKRFCVSTGEPVIHHFDEDRLLRRNWLIAAKKMGRSSAYMHHHWRHQTATRLHFRFFRTLAQYYFWRTMRRGECSTEEGIPEWELALLERLHRLRHHIVLRNCPRNYDQYGLIKHRPN